MYQEVELDFATESDNPQILSRLKDHPAFLFRLPTILQATRGAYAGQSPATTNRGAAAQHLEFIFVFAAPRNLLGIRRTMTLSFSEKDWYSITLSTSGGPEYALYGTPFDKINSTYSTATTGGTVGIAATDTTDPSQQWQIVQYNASCHMLRTRSSIATAWLRMPTSNLNPSYEVMSLPVDMRSYAYQKSGDPMLWMIEDDGGSAGPNFVNSALRPYWIMQPESNGVGRVTLQFNPSTKWRYSFTRQDMITTYNFQQTTVRLFRAKECELTNDYSQISHRNRYQTTFPRGLLVGSGLVLWWWHSSFRGLVVSSGSSGGNRGGLRTHSRKKQQSSSTKSYTRSIRLRPMGGQQLLS